MILLILEVVIDLTWWLERFHNGVVVVVDVLGV